MLRPFHGLWPRGCAGYSGRALQQCESGNRFMPACSRTTITAPYMLRCHALCRHPCAPRSQHMLAGAVAGTLEHTLMFPVDTVKTRMQALSHPGQQVAAPGPQPEGSHACMHRCPAVMFSRAWIDRTHQSPQACATCAGLRYCAADTCACMGAPMCDQPRGVSLERALTRACSGAAAWRAHAAGSAGGAPAGGRPRAVRGRRRSGPRRRVTGDAAHCASTNVHRHHTLAACAPCTPMIGKRGRGEPSGGC